VLALVMTWWITFTVVVTLCLCLGFGPAGIVAGNTSIHTSSTPQLLLTNSAFLTRLPSRGFPVVDVRCLYTCRRPLCNSYFIDDAGSGDAVSGVVWSGGGDRRDCHCVGLWGREVMAFSLL
jgi:hypothetical protein